MSDKLNELENVIPEAEETAVEEVSEEIIEEVVEEAEEPTEEVAEETDETVEEAEVIDDEIEAVEDTLEENADEAIENEEAIEDEIDTPKKSKAPVAIIVAIVVVVAAIIAIAVSFFGGNKYESDDYPAISGLTVADVANQMGISVEEFLAAYELPADMPETTSQEAAFYLVPAKKFAEMNGLDFQTLMTELNIPAETTVSEAKGFFGKLARLFAPEKPQPITEETPWGVVLGELTIANYVGEENIEEFKEFYGLDDSVTGETLYKEVRDDINKKTIELMAEQEKAAEEAQTDNVVEEIPTDSAEENTEAPVEEPTETPAE